MTNINSGVIVGRLGRDAEVKYSGSGVAVANFSIANNQSKKDGDSWTEETHWFDCVLFGKRADALQKYLLKGQLVALQYRLSQDKWQDKETGKNRSKVTLIVDDINLVGGKSESRSSEYSGSGLDSDDSDFVF